MKQYLDIGKQILEEGIWKETRTGIRTKSITGAMFKHDMSKGFPILTTKLVSLNTVFTELEGFIWGITSKQWYKDRKCNIWNQWCNPQKVPYGNDPATKAKMEAEDDLGNIYGAQWRRWSTHNSFPESYDQLTNVLHTLLSNPLDRRMIVTAWNPSELDSMALPPCHLLWQVLSDGTKVDLVCYMRSVDWPLGAPYNIASYAMLLKLICNTVNMKPGILVMQFADTHIYEDQIPIFRDQLSKTPMHLPVLECSSDIFSWHAKDYELIGYKHHGKLAYPLAV